MAVSPELRAVGARLTARTHVIGPQIAAVIRRELPELCGLDPGLDELLQQVIDSNIDNLVTGLTQGVRIDEVAATTAGTEHARRLAARGVPAEVMVRAYQLGHHELVRCLLNELSAAAPQQQPDYATLQAALDYAYAFNDQMCEAAVRAHAEAHDDWSKAVGAGIARRVGDVLTGRISDPDTASRLLSYDIRATHVGLVLWRSDEGGSRTLAGIEQRLRQLPGVRSVLIAPQDESTCHGWLQIRGSDAPVHRWAALMTEQVNAVRIAAGGPHDGLEGFRATHQEACAARDVAELAGERGDRFTWIRDVAPLNFLARHPDEARAWVRQVLGSLATDSMEADRLRETLRIFLSTGENTAATADQLSVHRNTVKYRVARAGDLLPVDVATNRLNIGLALAYLHQAPAVLSS